MSTTAASPLLRELCPVCTSDDVRAIEPDWFAVEFDRRGELAAAGEAEVIVLFGCRDCGWQWG
jgi:hypothetical protein